MSLIGLQLYTVKEEFERDPRNTLKQASEMGYNGVEFYGSYAGLSMQETRAELDKNGLKAAGAVVPMEKLLDGTELLKAIVDCGTLNTDVIICPWIDANLRDSEERCRLTARQLNEAGVVCRKYGITFLYHVHGYEFMEYNGKTLMQILLEETDPKYLNLEVDVFWVEDGGQDALQFLRDNWSRTFYIHLKDMRDYETKHDIEVGDGIIDMNGIITLAVKKNCPWLIVEQEAFDMPTLNSAAKSYRNIKKILLGIM